MSTQLAIRLDKTIKERFAHISRQEGKTASGKVRELIEAYLRKSDISSVVDDIWMRIGERMRKRGVTDKDIDRVIGEVRSSR